MSCMYKFYEYFPEAYDKYNISCWLDMQDSLIEEFGTRRLGFEVHLKNKSISIWRPEDKYTELNLCIDCVPYSKSYYTDEGVFCQQFFLKFFIFLRMLRSEGKYIIRIGKYHRPRHRPVRRWLPKKYRNGRLYDLRLCAARRSRNIFRQISLKYPYEAQEIAGW